MRLLHFLTIKNRRLAAVLLICFLFPFFSACSSAPRRPDEIFFIRITAANQLNLANHNASQGRFVDALIILEDAWRLVLSTDDPELRINTTTSRANILFSLERHEEAFSAWETAIAEGEASGLPVLAARARIYSARARLVMLSHAYPQGGHGAEAQAEELRAQVLQNITAVRGDNHGTAAGNLTLAMAEKQLGRWNEAEDAARRALRIYERNRFLEDAAYSWFLIGSIRSLSGNYDSALAALRTAISFDRRAENGFGLASSWHAMGDVYRNAGRIQESRYAHRRAAEIYRAIGLFDHAESLENF